MQTTIRTWKRYYPLETPMEPTTHGGELEAKNPAELASALIAAVRDLRDQGGSHRVVIGMKTVFAEAVEVLDGPEA